MENNKRISKASVSVFTNRYESEYGKRPYGYGTWFFKCSRGNDKKTLEFVGMYGESKAKAVEYCAENGYWSCSVLS